MQFCRAIVVGIRAAFVVADNITPFREYIGETPHAPRDTSARNEPDFIDFNGLTICWGCIVCCSLTCFFCSSATRLSDTISTSSSSQSFWAVATVIFFASSSTDIVSTYSRHNQAIYVAKPRKKKNACQADTRGRSALLTTRSDPWKTPLGILYSETTGRR